MLLDAALGKGASYRAIIDCKTSASGTVSDGQVDWITFQDHNQKHEADFAALVAPSPGGGRLFSRAEDAGVTVLSVEQLIALCQQHAEAPLGLVAYRKLFETVGAADMGTVSEEAEEWLRLTTLARAVVDAIATRSPQFGPLSARDLVMVLADDPIADGAREEEVASLLKTLASPLIGILEEAESERFRLTTSGSVISHRLVELGERLGERSGHQSG